MKRFMVNSLCCLLELTYQDHFLLKGPIICQEIVIVHAGGNQFALIIRRIPNQRILAGWLVGIHQRLDGLAQQIGNRQANTRRLIQGVLNDGGWIEGIWIILSEFKISG